MYNIDQESMYRLYAHPVYCFLFSLCHNAQLAEELTSETFYQAIRCINRYDGTCELKSWLFQIAKNVWRKEARRSAHAPKSIYEEKYAETYQIEDAVEESIDRIAFYKQVNSLEEPYRTVVYLRLSGDLTFDEIGQILDRTNNWARIIYYRAKEKLKKQNEKQ